MKIILKLIILSALLSSCRALVIEKPADLETEVLPVSPGQGFVYIKDSWTWDQHSHYYRPSRGYWTKPKSHIRVDGHWKKRPGGWKYVQGHWG